MNSAWPNERIDSAASTPFPSLPMSSAHSIFGALFQSLYSNLNTTAKDNSSSSCTPQDVLNEPLMQPIAMQSEVRHPSASHYELGSAASSPKGVARVLAADGLLQQKGKCYNAEAAVSEHMLAAFAKSSASACGRGPFAGPTLPELISVNSSHRASNVPPIGPISSPSSLASAASSASSNAHLETTGGSRPQPHPAAAATAPSPNTNALSIERILGNRQDAGEHCEGHGLCNGDGATAMERIEHTCRDGGAGGAMAAARHAAAVAAAGIGLSGLPVPLVGMPPIGMGVGPPGHVPPPLGDAASVAAERQNAALPMHMLPFAHVGPGGVIGPGGNGPLVGGMPPPPPLMRALPLPIPMSLPMAMQMQMGLPMQMQMPFNMQMLAANQHGTFRN